MNADIGLIGLAVMGQNLVLNLEDHGYSVVVYNRTNEITKEFANMNGHRKIIPTFTLEEFVNNIHPPRKIFLLIKAGKPVDDLIDKLLPLIQENDILIDGGNSHYLDTNRRFKDLKQKKVRFIGTGISGGEEGARFGPSIMPGGSKIAWQDTKEILQSIAAKVEDGSPCCQWIGPEGSGHYVKMVHNGIEYGDMQLIAEIYDFMKNGVKMSNDEIAKIFKKWNRGKLNSYLIEITADILTVKKQHREFIIDKILDVAGQKGTGKWTAISALNDGVSISLIAEAVFQRYLSSSKNERVQASKLYNKPMHELNKSKSEILTKLENALYASKIISYSQGFSLLKSASEKYKWNLNFGEIALMWRGGCIIRSAFLQDIKKAFDKNNMLENLLLDEFFIIALKKSINDWRWIVSNGINLGIPIPGLSSALSYFDGYTQERLPASLIQAQRDYFGAHTFLYENDLETPHHIDWKRRSALN